MKSIQKVCHVMAVLVAISILFSGCGNNKTDPEKFREAKEKIVSENVENLVLVNTKNICKKTLIENDVTVKDVFINAFSMDGQCYIEAHVLTEDSEYKVFRIKTKMSGPLYTALTKGYAGNYQQDLEEYLSNVNPILDGNYIYFD